MNEFNPLIVNAKSSIRDNGESISKIVDSRESHREKSDVPKMTTDDGI
jgi:hypothetical protein